MEAADDFKKAPPGAFFSHSNNICCALGIFCKNLNYFLIRQMPQKLLADQVLST